MGDTLEKIVNFGKHAWNFVKDNAKVELMLGSLAIGGYFSENIVQKANAETVRLVANVDGTSQGGGDYYAIVDFGRKPGATETFDVGIDAQYFPPMPKNIGVFSTICCDPNKLDLDMRDPNSMTDYNLTVETVGNDIGGNQYWRIDITDANGSEWKNMFIERYGKNGNLNDPNDIIGFWDIKYRDDKGYFQEGYLPTQSSGLADQLKKKTFNHADLNRDRRVDGLDYAIWSNEYGKDDISDPCRFGIYVGSDVNDLGAYADIDRKGSVDMNDLDFFSYEWLWDADDANTW